MGSQASAREEDILGGMGRRVEASREGQRQHVESVGSQASVMAEDILGGGGRRVNASREGQ